MTTSLPNRGLPLTRKRSSVFSDRRERATIDLLVSAPGLAAAVAVVLSRYHGLESVPLGLGSSEPRAAQVEMNAGESMRELRARVAGTFSELNGSATPVEGARNPNFDVSVVGAPAQTDYREDVVLYPNGNNVEVLWRTRVLDADMVQRFLGHVRAAIAAPDEQLVSDVYLLTEVEETLLRSFESGGEPARSLEPVHLQVLEQARRTPDTAALLINGREVTYRELDRRSGAIARALVEKGVQTGDSVALCVSAPSGVSALLGILRTGAAAVPLDATFPRARLQSQLEQSGARIGVLDKRTAPAVPLAETILLEDLAWEADEQFPAAQVAADSPVYILFTSGSTGIPKGIKMPHRGLTNVVGWQLARSAERLRTLQRTSLAFDVGMQEVFSTLCAGGCLVVADDETRADPSRLPDFIARNGIQRVFVPPVSLYQIAATLDAHPQSLPTLSEVYVAGEALKIDPAVVRLFRNVNAILENQYGPTETHVATTFRFGDSPLRWPTRPPIGRPVPGMEVRIVDEHGRRVPIGTTGEILVCGAQVALGYVLGKEFIDEDGTPCYATGDLGAWTPSGEIEFLGRKDRQVKSRGYRIELGEIEVALQSQPGVRLATVAALGENGQTRIAAWLVPGEGFAGVGNVRKRLLEVLPEHMVPALNAMATVAELPLTPTGKVDVAALKPPAEEDLTLGAKFAPTRTEIEAIVAEIWRRELGLDRIGVDDDFIEIGGHSLVAIRIVSQLNERFGLSLPLRLLLRGGTVATIARRLTDINPLESLSDELVRCPLPDGRVVLAPFAAEAQYLWKDVFEEDSYGPPVVYNKDAVIVDVGAHIGLYTLYALAAAPLGRVIAIEPVPILFEALRRNTVEFVERISYHMVAAGDADGAGTLTYYPRLSGMSSLRADARADSTLLRRIVRNLLEKQSETNSLLNELDEIVSERLLSQTLSCPVRRLDGILNEVAPERIDVLKIDVQRYEEPVLHGLGDVWPRVQQVVVEVHDENGALKRIDSLLRDRGFATDVRQQGIHVSTPVRFIIGRK